MAIVPEQLQEEEVRRRPTASLRTEECCLLVVAAETSGQCEPSDRLQQLTLGDWLQPKFGYREFCERLAAADVWNSFQPKSRQCEGRPSPMQIVLLVCTSCCCCLLVTVHAISLLCTCFRRLLCLFVPVRFVSWLCCLLNIVFFKRRNFPGVLPGTPRDPLVYATLWGSLGSPWFLGTRRVLFILAGGNQGAVMSLFAVIASD